MMTFKCKMCGGTLEFKTGDTVATCDSCGTLQTLPKMDDEHRTNLYDRANHYRRANEFDKAMGIYEQILNEDKTDAESYWSLVLCRYGIEYVEDPISHKRVPTVNRAQYTSVYDDEDYKSALQYATAEQKKVYEEEANAINEIQKGILAISQKEKPFDVFICYKETDENGRRTQDSVLANDLYHQLTQEGFKVFFSRITLEDKLGTAYEPYIFAALNSAKVMVVIGTKEEYFNAVWVKNEWSRFLALIREGKNKTLIPAYWDMDPYDLPEEFSHLQAQDMSKLGFMQDLIRGIKKMIGVEKKNKIENTNKNGAKSNIQPLLTRTAIFLEDENWEKADQYAERILDMNPKCAEAYLDKMMAQLHVKNVEQLSELSDSFEENKNYKKYIRYADEEGRKKIDYLLFVLKSKPIYEEAIGILNHANTTEECKEAKRKFEKILEYEDSAIQIEQCEQKIAQIMDNTYNQLVTAYEGAVTLNDYNVVLERLKKINGYKDSPEYIIQCAKHIDYLNAMNLMLMDDINLLDNAKKLLLGIDGFEDSNEKIKEINEKIESIKKKNGIKIKVKKLSILTATAAVVVAILLLFGYYTSDAYKISVAKDYAQKEKYQNAQKKLDEIDYNDSLSKEFNEIGDILFKKKAYNYALSIYTKTKNKKMIHDVNCKQAEKLISESNYDDAVSIYKKIGENEKANDTLRKKAYSLVAKEHYEDAIKVFETLKEKQNVRSTKQKLGYYYLRQNEYDNGYKIFKEIKDEVGKRYALTVKAKALYDNEDFSSALKLYKKLGDKDGVNKTENKLKMVALYKQAKKEYENELYITALNTVEKIEDYSPAETLKKEIEDEINRLKPDVPQVGDFFDATRTDDYGFVRLRVCWNTVSQADGYEYYTASNSNPPSTNGLIYYTHYEAAIYASNVELTFKVRAYREVNGERIYGDWSRVVTVNGNDYLQ